MDKDIKLIVMHYGAMMVDEHIFFQPNIPTDKLAAAIKSYAQDVEPGDVLVLGDDTLRVTATEGFLVTDRQFHAYKKHEKPKKIELNAIEKAAYKEGILSGTLLINGVPFFEVINYPKKEIMRLFVRMLNELTTSSPTEEAGIDPFEALKKLKELLDTGIITQEEYQSKRNKYLARL